MKKKVFISLGKNAKTIGYSNRVTALYNKAEKSLGSPNIFDVDICHDEWCLTQKGQSICNCKPDIYLRKIE
jgi:hypothetical protein